MTTPTAKEVPIHIVGTNALIEELWQRGDLDLALREFKRRSAARPASGRYWVRLFGRDIRVGRRTHSVISGTLLRIIGRTGF